MNLPSRRGMDMLRGHSTIAILLVLAVVVAGVAWVASGSSSVDSAQSGCNRTSAVSIFGQDGHGFGSAHPVAPLSRSRAVARSRVDDVWLRLFCHGHSLGPATSRLSRRGKVWSQEFAGTAHVIRWNGKKLRLSIRPQPRLAAKIFSARGIRPQWDQPIAASWLTAYYAGTNYGAALEPVNGDSVRRQQQVFVNAAGTFDGSSVSWRQGSHGPPLYQASKWRPIGRATGSFDSAVKAQEIPQAAQYLVPSLAAKVVATCPQQILGFTGWPQRFRYGIRLWSSSSAEVRSHFLVSGKRVVDQFTLENAPPWRISAVTAVRGGTSHPPCPPWSPPANAYPGTYAVGDSVMVDAQTDLQTMGITVDAMVDRQFDTGIGILRQLQASSQLPPRVVIGLGTNGPMTAQDYASALRMLHGETRVVLLTVREPRWWQDQVNQVVHQMAKRFSNVRIADFFQLSAGHPEWFAGDGVHLQLSGALGFTRAVANALAAP